MLCIKFVILSSWCHGSLRPVLPGLNRLTSSQVIHPYFLILFPFGCVNIVLTLLRITCAVFEYCEVKTEFDHVAVARACM